MVREAVGNDQRLHVELIRSLANSNIKEALYFAKTFNVPRSEWPWFVAQLDTQNSDGRYTIY